jgi:hypothetical protein
MSGLGWALVAWIGFSILAGVAFSRAMKIANDSDHPEPQGDPGDSLEHTLYCADFAC